ncbi:MULTISPECIES: type II secretion system protein M [unclassified Sphingomonas]|uniref:type II secretion system protein M n=1 Tax=unclassified Sphingomonas TaxID=196159 RepID=UPI0006FCF32D|nr:MULTISPECIES: type II secretion system protein M [unclassified Sphingomonas]KQX21659.1 general secretion pathway protein GspM [Sphingomonas sp. Root1294]KQY72975.1 general secretion pathway protein GspM [Sphingomonas sp. Root50]KRB88230.1 general secretion pathway protein GspM [Sphingomonas sp. Root720]
MKDFATLFPTFEPARQKAIAAWQARSRREQWLLGGLAAILVLWVLVTMVILPIQRGRAQALSDIRTYESLTVRLRGAGPIGQAPAQPQANASPAAILSTSAARFGVVPVVNPDGDGFRVTIADAPYEAVVRWIADVEQTSRLRVIGLRLDRRPSSGFVSAELTVRA